MDDVKSTLTRFFAHVPRNRPLRAEDGAVVTDSPNMLRTLGNCYVSVYHTDEGSDHPSLPEPSTVMNSLQLSTLDTARGPGPDNLHPFMQQVLADFITPRES